MVHRLSFLVALIAAVFAFEPRAAAQASDLIVTIAGDSGFESDNQTRYFNRQNCGLSATGGTGGTGGAGGIGGTGGVGGDGGSLGAGGGGGSAGGTGGAGGVAALAGFDIPKGAGTSGTSPETTSLVIRLGGTDSVSNVFLWVGGENGECQRNESRNETNGTCGEIAGNPWGVGNNRQVGVGQGGNELTLEDILDAASGSTNIVDCETSGLQGTPYEIFAFRNSAPGSTDVDPSQYGITQFRVDVQAPNLPLLNTTPQSQSTFNLSWGDPDPPDLIQTWQFYCGTTSDAANAQQLPFFSNTAARSRSIPASTLQGVNCLDDQGQGFLFMSAYDQAFVSEDTTGGNESDRTSALAVTFVPTGGFCDLSGDCEGCSAARFTIVPGGGPGPVAWLFGLLLGLVVWRRLRR